MINEKQNKSHYEEIFEKYFDFLDPNVFEVNQSAYGAIITKVNHDFVIHSSLNIGLSKFDSKLGLLLNKPVFINLAYQNRIAINDNMTLMITFKHRSNPQDIHFDSNSSKDSVGIRIENDNLKLTRSAHSGAILERFNKPIISNYRNKQLMLWISKKGPLWQVKLCANGGLINQTTNWDVDIYRITFIFSKHIQRIGFSRNFYVENGPEFHKILFLEKSKNTYLP